MLSNIGHCVRLMIPIMLRAMELVIQFVLVGLGIISLTILGCEILR